jgi:hypothetical protein
MGFFEVSLIQMAKTATKKAQMLPQRHMIHVFKRNEMWIDFIYLEYPVDGSTACSYVLTCHFGTLILKIHNDPVPVSCVVHSPNRVGLC